MFKKYLNKSFLLFTFLLSIILFCLFPISMQMEYLDEVFYYPGYGFPFIYKTRDATTSIYQIIDIRHFIIDFLFYFLVLFGLVILACKLFKLTIAFKQPIWIVLCVISILSVICFIPTLLFSSFDKIDYSPIYHTIKPTMPFCQ